jgi:hypothetical protein
MFWTRLTADLVTMAYVVAIGLRLVKGRWIHAARAGWLIGAVLLVVHVLTAYGEVHGWSQAAALEHTRQETLRQTGWNSSLGLWFNFVTVVLWITETARIHRRQPSDADHRPIAPTGDVWVAILSQAWIAFMMIQAAIVFAEGPLRWLAGAAMLVLAGTLLARRRWSA